MKKLINKPEDAVRESLEGMAAVHSDIIGHQDPGATSSYLIIKALQNTVS